MTKTLEQINARLVEIDNELVELADIDYDGQLKQAIVNGDDPEPIEEAQTKTERHLRRLRIEHETLTEILPDAKRADVQPQLDEIQDKHAEQMKEAARVAAAACKKWAGLLADLERYESIRNESASLTREAIKVGNEVDAPIPDMGHPLSMNLFAALKEMERISSRFNTNGIPAGRLRISLNDFIGRGVEVDKGAA